MYAKTLITSLVILFSAHSFAQSATSEASKKEELKSQVNQSAVDETLNYLKDHFSATYHGEYYFQRRLDAYFGSPAETGLPNKVESDKDLQDIKYMHNPTVIFKPMKNLQVLATAEFKHTDAPEELAGTFVNDYFRSLFTVTLKNILNEKDHFVGLDFGIGRRDFNTRLAPANFGNYRAFSTISKTLGKHSGSLFVQYLYNDPNAISAATWKHGLEVIPTITFQLNEKLSYMFNDDINLNLPRFNDTQKSYSLTHEMNMAYINYQWTDKIGTYYQLKYYHTENFKNNSKDDYGEHYAGLSYSVSPKFTTTLEVGNEIWHANDGKGFFGNKAKYPEFALYIDASL